MESYVTYPFLVEVCCIRVPCLKKCLPVSINMDGVSLEFGQRHGSTDERLGSNTPQVGTGDVTSKQKQKQKQNKQKDPRKTKQTKAKSQGPKSPAVALTWDAIKYEVHKLHRRYIPNHSSGAVWESRWPSWAVRPNEPSGFRGRKDLLNHASALVSACP